MVSSPSPPDPYQQADAQAGANIDSAIATDLLNNRTEITPTGTVEYIDQGTRTIVDSQGKSREVPVRDRVITLSPNQQELLDLTEQTSANLLGTAVERSDFLGDYLSDGLDTSGLTPWAGPAQAPQLDTGALNFTPLRGYEGPQGSLVYGYDGADTEFGRVSAPGELTQVSAPGELSQVSLNSGVQLGNVSVGRGGGSSGTSIGLRNAADTFDVRNLNLQQASGNVPGAGQGIQNTVNLDTEGGQIGPLRDEFRIDRVSGEIADAGEIERYDGSGTFDNVGDIQATLGVNDYGTQRNAVEDAIMSRYNRHFAEMESALDQKLRNQGLEPGTEAYDRQFRQLREQQNDAVMQSVLAGGQEQSRLFGLDLAAAQYGLGAQGQGFNQAQARGLFGLENAAFNNQAQGQEFGQNVAETQMRMSEALQNAQLEEARARFGNEAQAQAYVQTLQNAAFGNDALLAMGDFRNRAQDQRVGQMADQTALGIQAAGVNNQFELGRGSLANEGASIDNAYTIGMGNVNNQAARVANDLAIAQANLDLQAQVASNDALLAEAGFNNDIVTQGLQNELAATGFNNAALAQGLQNELLSTGFNNAATQAEIDNAAAASAFNNAAYGQDLAGELSLAGFNAGVTQQNNQNLAQQQAALNQYLAQQYALDQGAADRQNQLRQNELQEAAYLRGLPISEINSLMSGSELLMPSFTPPLQTGVAAAPIGQYMQDAYRAELANASSTANGLFGFAGNVLGALPIFGSDRRLKKNIRRIGELRNGVPVYSFTYRHDGSQAVGVMSDEAGHIPGAVINLGGVDFVNYEAVMNHAG